MRLHILKLNFVLIIFQINTLVHAQNNDGQNTFSLKLNVPVIIDEEIKKEYVPERMQDIHQEFQNKKTAFTVDTKTTKLNYFNNRFQGTYKNEYFPYNTVNISGKVSPNHMTLESMVVTSNWNVEDQYMRESESCELHFENVPMYNGNCLFDKAVSKVKLTNYSYAKTEINHDYYTYTNTRTAKEIDLEEIPKEPKLAAWKFRIQLKMDGPPSFIVESKKIRGQDLEWEPPISEIVGNEKQYTPNAFAFYYDDKVDEETKDYLDLAIDDLLILEEIFSETKFTVCDRKHLDIILGEHALNNTELVDPNARIESDITKEQFSIFVSGNASKRLIELQILSKSGGAKISAYNLCEENMLLAVHEIYEKMKAEIESMKP